MLSRSDGTNCRCRDGLSGAGDYTVVYRGSSDEGPWAVLVPVLTWAVLVPVVTWAADVLGLVVMWAALVND